MTSVEEAVGLARKGIHVPAPALHATGTVVDAAAVSPRASATLSQRRDWERRYRGRLQLGDAAILLCCVAAGAVVEILIGAPAPVVALRGLLLGALWMALLGVLHSREAAMSGTRLEEAKAIVHATALSFGVVAIAEVVLAWEGMRPTILIGLPLGMAGLLLGRGLARHRLQVERRDGRSASRALVVGNRADVEDAIRALLPAEKSGYRVVGATLLDGNARDLLIGDVRIPVFGNAITVGTVAAQLGTDTVVVASRPDGDPEFVKRLSWRLEGTAAELVLSNRLPDVAGSRLSFSAVDGLPLIRMRMQDYQGVRHLFKRIVDVLVAALALTPIAMLTPVLALLIKLDSPGPVFFLQERVGRDGRTFRMVKFRSMHTDAERQLAALRAQNQGAGLLFKMKEDPRVTRAGRVLRKLSLDELPQFWNVLIGDMSVVGPRPPLPREVAEYQGDTFRRLYVKPGITGLWQVSGRSDLSWEESVRLDLRYVENWSVADDLHIMMRTAKVMVQPTGAY